MEWQAVPPQNVACIVQQPGRRLTNLTPSHYAQLGTVLWMLEVGWPVPSLGCEGSSTFIAARPTLATARHALIVPITYHHNLVGGEGENLNFALMVHLANILTKKNNIGLNHELEIPEPSDMVEEVLGLDAKKVKSISEELNNAKEYIQEFFRYLKG